MTQRVRVYFGSFTLEAFGNASATFHRFVCVYLVKYTPSGDGPAAMRLKIFVHVVRIVCIRHTSHPIQGMLARICSLFSVVYIDAAGPAVLC